MSDQSPDSLRRTLFQQKQTIKQLEILTSAYEREILQRDLSIKEKESKLDATSKEIYQLKNQKQYLLIEIQNLKKLLKNNASFGYSHGLTSTIISPKMQTRGTLQQSKFEHHAANHLKDQQYIIQPIRLRKQPLRQKEIPNNMRQNMEPNPIQKTAGTTLAENFFIIGPDANDIGIYQQKNPQSNTLKLKPTLLFQWDKRSKNDELQNKNKDQILLRAFPDQILAKKIKSKKYDGDIREVIEWIPNYNISEGYFVINLLGSLDHRDNSKRTLSQCNVNKQLYILCLKIPDIVSFKGRRSGQGDLWIVEKIYAISSYYPFFDCHIKLLVELCRGLVFQRMKQLKQGRQRFQYLGLEFNIRAFAEQSSLTEMLKSYINRKPVCSEVYNLSTNFVGTLHSNDAIRLAQASFSSGILFSNIAYDEFLLILTALLSQKTVILVSKSPTISTFCALSLIGLITPFKYSYPIILNCDQTKIDDIIFQSPFPILASVTTKQISKIVSQAVQTNIRNQGTQFILFDLDSNSILMDKHLKNSLQKLIPVPPQSLRQQYLQFNPCRAKSLFLPKQMKIVKGGLGKKKAKTKLQEKQQLKRLIQQQFLEQIEQNQSKSINWLPNHNLTEKFNSFISQFQYSGTFPKLRKGQEAKEHISNIKQSLLKTHKSYKEFLSVFMQNQIFTEYLDSKLYP